MGGVITDVIGQLGVTVGAIEVWYGVGVAIVVAGLASWLGGWVLERAAVFPRDATITERFGPSLSFGLTLLIPIFAAIWSTGRSAFTIPAIAGMVVLAMAVRARLRSSRVERSTLAVGKDDKDGLDTARQRRRLGILGFACIFIALVAVLYGATLAPRTTADGTPIEFMDTAFYAILGRDLGVTGLENSHSPSGIPLTSDATPQVWYHWGEMWLATAAIELAGMSPMDARHFVALPVLLLAAATTTGSLVMRLTRSRTWKPFVFGAAACVALAPAPVIVGPYFSWWATGLLFGITHYGLAATAVLLTMYLIAVHGKDRPTWLQAAILGTSAAIVLPSHIVLAVEGAFALAVAAFVSIISARRKPGALRAWRDAWFRPLLWVVWTLVPTLIWGVVTGHGIGGSAPSEGVAPFNETWMQSLGIIALGAGCFLGIPIGIIRSLETRSPQLGGYVGVSAVVVAAAVGWGARLADFNMFHVFFGALAVFATPLAAVGTWSVIRRLRSLGRSGLAVVTIVLCVLQMEITGALTLGRLHFFGAAEYDPLPPEIITAIDALPEDAVLAYRCAPLVEIAVWDPRLVAVDAHTGHRIVPMCHQADLFRTLIGADPDRTVDSPFFFLAQQRELYPTAAAAPTDEEVVAFLRRFGIEYLLSDTRHPSLLPAAPVLASTPTYSLQRLP